MKVPLELASMHLVDVVIVDYLVPEMNGQEVAMKLTRFMPEAPIIMLSVAIDVAEQVLNLVNVFLAKDSLATQLLPMIAQLHRCGSTSPASYDA
jgi:DNA-binding NarL/FixJ family response regulator